MCLVVDFFSIDWCLQTERYCSRGCSLSVADRW